MSEEKLICGCRGEIKSHQGEEGFWLFCENRESCGLETALFDTEAEAIAALKLATRFDKQKESFIEGYLEALHDFAWWKDGVQYVGCGVLTLEQARENFKAEINLPEK